MRNVASLLVLCTFLFVAVSVQAVPNLINYQGVLTDSGGTPLNQDVSITFRLFDAATAGTAAWSETQTVTVSNGVYSVQLGQSTPLAGVDFTVDYWLEVEVGGEILTPRQALTSVPYAMTAATAENVNLNSNFTLGTQWISADGDDEGLFVSDSGHVGVGTATPVASLSVAGGEWDVATTEGDFRIGTDDNRLKIGVATEGGGAGIARIYAAGANPKIVLGTETTDVFAISGENVGIGTLDPTDKLQVEGNVNVNGSVGVGTLPHVDYGMNVSGNTIGGVFRAINTDEVSEATGLFAYANGAGGENHYGVYGTASGANHNYGIYGSASGSTGQLWAGYFNGNTRITKHLEVGPSSGSIDSSRYGLVSSGELRGGHFIATGVAPDSFVYGVYAEAVESGGLCSLWLIGQGYRSNEQYRELCRCR